MRLIIDLQSCQSGSRFGGIGRYSLELAKAMASTRGRHDVLIALNGSYPEASGDVRKAFQGVLPPDAVFEFAIPSGISYLQKRPRLTRASERIRESFIADLEPDVVHISSLIEGLADEIVTTVGGTGDRVATAATLYDLIPYRQQDAYLGDAIAKRHYLEKFESLKRTDALLAISQFSADEGRTILTGYKGVIANILGGIDPSFRALSDPKAGMEAFLAKHRIDGPFLLYTASFDQRKNQKGLIEAFAKVRPDVRRGHKLVIVGNGWPGVYAELTALAEKRGLRGSDVVFTGYVNDHQLLALYNLCRLFVFPSHWEGLGLPVIEAMACGVPVIGSNTTSIREVLGTPLAEFDPTDTVEMAAKITQGLTDEAFRGQLIAHGREHIKEFTWPKSAKRAWAAIEEAVRQVQSRPAPVIHSDFEPTDRRRALIKAIAEEALDEEQLREVAYAIAANEVEVDVQRAATAEQKLGVVSSWATRCGIASYTRFLVERINLPVTVLAAQVNEQIPFGDTPTVVCWRQDRQDTLQELSVAIDRLALTDVFIQFNYGFYAFASLDRLIREQVRKGRRVYLTLHATIDPPDDILPVKLAELADALSLASVVFVHSAADVERLKSIGLGRQIVLIPQGVRLSEAVLPTRSGKGDRRLRIGCYGFFLPGKGLLQLIEAVALLRDAGRDIELQMTNAEYGDAGGVSRREIAAARALVANLDLEDRVIFETRYLDDDQSLVLLSAVDLVVYAYQRTGESSSAAVRFGLASCKPVAVTPLPIFDDVAGVTLQLPGTSPQDLAQGIGDWLDRIDAGDAETREIAEAAERWRFANDCRRVAAFTRKIIRKHGAHYAWSVGLAQSATEMAIAAGQLENDVVRANGAAGIVVYGPYASLAAGVYRLTVYGEVEEAGEADIGHAELAADCGGRVLARLSIAPDKVSGALADGFAYLPTRADNVEVRVFTSGASPLTVSRWELRRRAL